MGSGFTTGTGAVAGRPILLLHGLASTCRIWDLVAPILARDFSVVAVDQRGHGESDKPGDGYDFATVSRDLHGFVQALGLERPVVVGHSWGGNVALEYGVAYPGAARGLCFIDGGTIEVSARPGMTLERARKEMAPPVFTGVTLDEMRERARAWRPELPHSPEIEEIRLSNFEVLQDGTVRARLNLENHMRIIEAFWEQKPIPLLYARVECPVLLMPARQPDLDPEARAAATGRRRPSPWRRRGSAAPVRPGWKTASTTYRCSVRPWWPLSSATTSGRASSISRIAH